MGRYDSPDDLLIHTHGEPKPEPVSTLTLDEWIAGLDAAWRNTGNTGPRPKGWTPR